MLHKSINEIISYANKPQRVIGLDLGEKTIGIAMSDQMKMVATGLETYKRKKFATDVQYVIDLANKHGVGIIVLGWPLNMTGEAGDRANWVEGFAVKLLESDASKHVLLWDERLSTMAVERTLLDADASRRRRGQVIDKLAATFILQGILDALP